MHPLPVRQHHWLAIATGVRNRFISIYEMTAPLIGLRYNGPAAIRLSLKYVVGPGFGYERQRRPCSLVLMHIDYPYPRTRADGPDNILAPVSDFELPYSCAALYYR